MIVLGFIYRRRALFSPDRRQRECRLDAHLFAERCADARRLGSHAVQGLASDPSHATVFGLPVSQLTLI
jgi:hypothetical protein